MPKSSFSVEEIKLPKPRMSSRDAIAARSAARARGVEMTATKLDDDGKPHVAKWRQDAAKAASQPAPAPRKDDPSEDKKVAKRATRAPAKTAQADERKSSGGGADAPDAVALPRVEKGTGLKRRKG